MTRLLISTIATIAAERLEIVHMKQVLCYKMPLETKLTNSKFIRFLDSEGCINANVKYVKADIASSCMNSHAKLVMQNSHMTITC